MSDPARIRSGIDNRELIVQAVERLHREFSEWPTPGAVATATKMPRKTLQYHVRILEQAGRVRRLYGGRALEVLYP